MDITIKEEQTDDEESKNFSPLSETVSESWINDEIESEASSPAPSEPSEPTIDFPDKNNGIPEKSYKRYISCYECFMEWHQKRDKKSFSEEVVLEFFKERALLYKASSLMSAYSMIRAMLIQKHNVNISKYRSVTKFLKKQTSKLVSEKRELFTAEQINEFLEDAPDIKYLDAKVATILAIAGGCKSKEFPPLLSEHVKKEEDTFLVKVPGTALHYPRSFVIPEEYSKILERYTSLRPRNCPTNRFFLNFRYGKCINQPIGYHKFNKYPKKIAEFLKLRNAKNFTFKSLQHVIRSKRSRKSRSQMHTKYKPVESDAKKVSETISANIPRESQVAEASSCEMLLPDHFLNIKMVNCTNCYVILDGKSIN